VAVKVPAFTLPQRFRVRRMVSRYGKTKGWTGPVERRDPATYQRQQSDVGIKRCSSWPCKLWIRSDATRCPHCHERQGV
jgi:hypothetical protein